MPNEPNFRPSGDQMRRVTRPAGTASPSAQNPSPRPRTASSPSGTQNRMASAPSGQRVNPSGNPVRASAPTRAYPGRPASSQTQGTAQRTRTAASPSSAATRRPASAVRNPAPGNSLPGNKVPGRTVSSAARTTPVRSSGTQTVNRPPSQARQSSTWREKSWMPLIIFLVLTAAILIGVCAAVAIHSARHPVQDVTTPAETTSPPETTQPPETTAPETTRAPETTEPPSPVEPDVPDITFVSDLSAFEAYMNPADRDAYLKLINEDSPLAADYVPDGMIQVVDTRKDGRAVQYMLETPEKAMEAMLAESRACGCQNITVTSAYRSYSYQQQLFTQRVNQYLNGRTQDEAYALAATIVAVPGTSEHQSGLCADIHNISTGADVSFGDTAEGKWLAENCWKFGYILRYPADKTEETKISYEPWHFRFVGRYHAYQMWKDGICFEEYTARLAQNN